MYYVQMTNFKDKLGPEVKITPNYFKQYIYNSLYYINYNSISKIINNNKCLLLSLTLAISFYRILTKIIQKL